MSLGSILSVARSGLATQQVVMQTAGHNIANVETEGFSRQRVETNPLPPQRFTYGSVGTGVNVDNVRRARDELLDVSYRDEASDAASFATRHELLGALEGVMGEPSDSGLAAGLDAMWSSWSELASNPTSQAARSVVLQRARTAASTLNGYDARLQDLRTQTTLRLENSLVEVNNLVDEVARLNGRIVESETGGKVANDLRDQRDRAIDRLSKFGELRALPHADGSTSVLLGNNTVVDGIHPKKLQIAVGTGERLELAIVGDPARPIQSLGGQSAAMVDFLNGPLSQTQERLDALASTLAESVNAIHARGNDGLQGANPANRPFFVDKTADPAKGDPRFLSVDAGADPWRHPLLKGTVTARTIAVNPEIDTDPSKVAATSSLASRPADNDVALAIAGLRTATTVTLNGEKLRDVVFPWRDRSLLGMPSRLPVHTGTPPAPSGTFPPTSMADQYRATTSGLAVQVKDAGASKEVHETLAQQADARRMAISGVNIDEELTTLMRAQQAYAAAAKVISVVDEMMDTLVQMV